VKVNALRKEDRVSREGEKREKDNAVFDHGFVQTKRHGRGFWKLDGGKVWKITNGRIPWAVCY